VNPTVPGLLAPASFKVANTPFSYAVALFPDGITYVLPVGAINGVPSRPAQAGDNVTLYGIGFGDVTPAVSPGQITPFANSLNLPMVITVGGVKTSVTYAGLAPGVVGLYQFNIVVPKLNASGPAMLGITLNGVMVPSVAFLALQ
jgi:uncharacterized protein (TIGR03437 family)